jgi:hypothetical protein
MRANVLYDDSGRAMDPAVAWQAMEVAPRLRSAATAFI